MDFLCVAFSPFSSRTHSLFIYLYIRSLFNPYIAYYTQNHIACYIYAASIYISSKRREKNKAEFGSGVKKLFV
jgi:hypothetical protein